MWTKLILYKQLPLYGAKNINVYLSATLFVPRWGTDNFQEQIYGHSLVKYWGYCVYYYI